MTRRFAQFHNVEAENPFMAEYSHSCHGSQAHHYEPAFQDLIDPQLSQVNDDEPMKRYLRQNCFPSPSFDPSLVQVSDEPIQRYLQQDYYTAPMPLPQSIPHSAFHHSQFTSVPSRSQGRGASPMSQHHSSGASSAQSPRTESDLPYESTQGPSTPPDMKSPFLPHTQMSESWDTQVDLTGLTYWHTDQTINPAKIHPRHVSLADCHDSDGIKGFNLDQGSVLDLPHSGHSRENVSELPFRHSSSENEIHVQPLTPVYPDPDPMDQDFGHGPQAVIESSVNGEEKKAESKPPMTRHRSDPSAGYQKSYSRQRRPDRTTLTRPAKVLRVANSQSGRMLPSTSSGGYYPCPECSDVVYKDDASLQKHIKTQHKRPFTCVFHFAGCTDAFANKNEWKRHVSAQHLNLQFWLCIHGTCGQTMNSDSDISGAATHGRPFRRKDLFTQHVRRMHIAAPAPDTKHRKKSTPEQDNHLKTMQDSAFRKRCEMPSYMRCPAPGCSGEFHGEKAWDDRMEHVARHLERAANNAEPPVEFGGDNDKTLTDWASSPTVRVICRSSNGWEQCQPLKGTKIDLQKVPSNLDEDAEGESY